MFKLPFPTDSLYKFSFMFGLFLIVFGFYYKDKQLNRYDTKQNYYKLDSLESNYYTLPKDSLPDTNSSDISYTNHRLQKYQDYLKDLRDKTPLLMKPYFSIDQLLDQITDWYKYLRLRDTGIRYKVSILDRKSTISRGDFVRNLTDKNRSVSYSKLEKFDRFRDSCIGKELDILFKVDSALSLTDSRIILQHSKLSQEINSNKFYFNSLLIVGFLLFIFGTIFWFIKIQIPQDKLLKMKVKEAKLELIDKENPVYINLGRKHVDPINIKQKRV